MECWESNFTITYSQPKKDKILRKVQDEKKINWFDFGGIFCYVNLQFERREFADFGF